MSKTNTELSVEIMYHFTEYLRETVEKRGAIKRNNLELWRKWLHRMPNEVWGGICETMLTLCEQHPELFTPHQVNCFLIAKELLDTYAPYFDGVLDMKNHNVDGKPAAWGVMMSMFEIWNTVEGLDPHYNHPDNSFDSLFEFYNKVD